MKGMIPPSPIHVCYCIVLILNKKRRIDFKIYLFFHIKHKAKHKICHANALEQQQKLSPALHNGVGLTQTMGQAQRSTQTIGKVTGGHHGKGIDEKYGAVVGPNNGRALGQGMERGLGQGIEAGDWGRGLRLILGVGNRERMGAEDRTGQRIGAED